jgi:hypothetical protein
MNTIGAIAGVSTLALVVWIVASKFGYHRGRKDGYNQGRLDSDNWWIRTEGSIDEARRKIWTEDSAA